MAFRVLFARGSQPLKFQVNAAVLTGRVLRSPCSSGSTNRILNIQTILHRKYSTEATEESRVLHLDHDTVLDGVKKHVVALVDVRQPEEIDSLGIIPTAYNIPVGEIEAALQLSSEDFMHQYQFEKPEPSGPLIVVYCRSGVRAERACQTFQKFGYKNVANYVGSWNDWSAKHPEDIRLNPITSKQG